MKLVFANENQVISASSINVNKKRGQSASISATNRPLKFLKCLGEKVTISECLPWLLNINIAIFFEKNGKRKLEELKRESDLSKATCGRKLVQNLNDGNFCLRVQNGILW